MYAEGSTLITAIAGERRATLKRRRDAEFDAQIHDIYRTLTADPATAAEAEAIVAPVVPFATSGESEAAHEVAFDRRALELRRRADASEAAAVQAEIALRLLYGELRRRQEAEDMAAVELLLAQVL